MRKLPHSNEWNDEDRDNEDSIFIWIYGNCPTTPTQKKTKKYKITETTAAWSSSFSYHRRKMYMPRRRCRVESPCITRRHQASHTFSQPEKHLNVVLFSSILCLSFTSSSPNSFYRFIIYRLPLVLQLKKTSCLRKSDNKTIDEKQNIVMK